MFWRRLLFGSISAYIEIPGIHTEEEFGRLCTREMGVLFKHSPSCFASVDANRRVRAFAEARPEVPTYMVSVIRQRELSSWIAVKTGVRHESPQVIVLRYGRVVAHMSHGQITAERLEQLIRAFSCAPPELRGLLI
jgi:bacillithiol system protein YtxJ